MDIDKYHKHKRPFKCSTCQNRFDSRYNLTIHKQKHIDDKSFTCTECGHRFHCQRNLKIHSRKLHGCDVDTVVCFICEKTFHNESRLKFHIKSHLKDLPYKCFRCHNVYLSSSQFKYHLKQEHNIVTSDTTVSNMFACPECSIGLSSVKQLVNHVSTHLGEEQHTCATCCRRFPLSSYLQAHECMAVHPCYNCEEKFATLRQMKHHRLTEHAHHPSVLTDYPYKCKSCDMRYSTASRLDRHDCRPGNV